MITAEFQLIAEWPLSDGNIVKQTFEPDRLVYVESVGGLVACGVAGALSVGSVNLLGAVAGMLYGHDLRARGVGWAVATMRLALP